MLEVYQKYGRLISVSLFSWDPFNVHILQSLVYFCELPIRPCSIIPSESYVCIQTFKFVILKQAVQGLVWGEGEMGVSMNGAYYFGVLVGGILLCWVRIGAPDFRKLPDFGLASGEIRGVTLTAQRLHYALCHQDTSIKVYQDPSCRTFEGLGHSEAFGQTSLPSPAHRNHSLPFLLSVCAQKISIDHTHIHLVIGLFCDAGQQ